MDEDRTRLLEEIRERLRLYGSFTSVGLKIPEATPASVPTQVEAHAVVDDVEEIAIGRPKESLETIQKDLGDCTRCKLHSGRTNVVFGVGNSDARLMFVGEGPGYDEDVQGEPFVGKAGQLLNKIIKAIDMTREEVYIANIVKCRPPGNRDPEPDEIATCIPFLERQIRSVRPTVLCSLGRIAAQALLRTERPLGAVRGRTFTFGDAILVPTYHPAYLLRNPSKKRDTWEDLKLVRRLLDERR